MVEVTVVLPFFPRSFHWPAPRFRGTGTGKTSSSPKTYKTGQEIRVKKQKKHERISKVKSPRSKHCGMKYWQCNNSSNCANIVKALKPLNSTETS